MGRVFFLPPRRYPIDIPGGLLSQKIGVETWLGMGNRKKRGNKSIVCSHVPVSHTASVM